MNVIKVITVCFGLVTSTVSIASTELNLPLEKDFKSLSIDQVRKYPRYIPIIDYNYYCANGFTEIEKATLPYLQDRNVIFLGHESYRNNAEAQLVRGIMYSEDEIRNELLQAYPEFLKHVQIHRAHCVKGNNKIDWALMSFKRSAELGSPLAEKFLELYRKRLGNEKFEMYMRRFSDNSAE